MRIKNLFFWVPLIIILINYVCLYYSYYLQNLPNPGWLSNDYPTMSPWDISMHISQLSQTAIVLCFVTRLIFIKKEKISKSESSVLFLMNLIAFILYLFVLGNRI